MSKLENELNNALASLASVLNSTDLLKSLNTNSLKKVECTNHKIHNDLNDVLAQSLKALSTLDVDNNDVETSEACNAADAADADKQYGEVVKQTKEMVNHPSHYKGNKFEAIDIIEDYKLNFNLGNALKYLLRAGHKDDYVQDLKKAIWYLNREIETLSK